MQLQNKVIMQISAARAGGSIAAARSRQEYDFCYWPLEGGCSRPYTHDLHLSIVSWMRSSDPCQWPSTGGSGFPSDKAQVLDPWVFTLPPLLGPDGECIQVLCGPSLPKMVPHLLQGLPTGQPLLL